MLGCPTQQYDLLLFSSVAGTNIVFLILLTERERQLSSVLILVYHTI